MAEQVMMREFDIETGIWLATLVETSTTFEANILDLFPDFLSYSRVQKEVIGGAVNRDLGDAIAGKPTDAKRYAAMKARWAKIIDGTAVFQGGGGGTTSPTIVEFRELLATHAAAHGLYKSLPLARKAVGAKGGEKTVFAALMIKQGVVDPVQALAVWDAAMLDAADAAAAAAKRRSGSLSIGQPIVAKAEAEAAEAEAEAEAA